MLQESYGLQTFRSPCVVAGGKYMLHQHLKRYSHLVKSLIAGGPTSATSPMLRICGCFSLFQNGSICPLAVLGNCSTTPSRRERCCARKRRKRAILRISGGVSEVGSPTDHKEMAHPSNMPLGISLLNI